MSDERERRVLQEAVVTLRAALTQSAEKVARLERTVERMREALRETNVAPREHGGDICCLCESTSEFAERLRHKPDCLLAASSPDHAGAPEGEGRERPPAEQQSRQATLPPSVEAGEGDK